MEELKLSMFCKIILYSHNQSKFVSFKKYNVGNLTCWRRSCYRKMLSSGGKYFFWCRYQRHLRLVSNIAPGCWLILIFSKMYICVGKSRWLFRRDRLQRLLRCRKLIIVREIPAGWILIIQIRILSILVVWVGRTTTALRIKPRLLIWEQLVEKLLEKRHGWLLKLAIVVVGLLENIREEGLCWRD